jgi:hypothetical protein
MLLTLCGLLYRFAGSGIGSRSRGTVTIAIGLALSLVTYCRFEAIYSLTLPCLFLFTWIGACLSPSPDAAAAHARKPRAFANLNLRFRHVHGTRVLAKP